jgi:amino acid transporter
VELDNQKKTLGVFHLIMINLIAVDSLRTLPFSAEYGLSLVFFYLVAACFFFIPSGLISAELGTGWPHTGGLYIWIREAFGEKIGLIAIWLNWVYNLAWYPTMMALIAGTFAYLFSPELAQNKTYMYLLIFGLFWTATLLNSCGMKISVLISTVGALIGTLLPMLLIIVLGLIWFFQGRPSEITFTFSSLFPTTASYDKLAFFSNILFGLIGLEMVAAHAGEMKNPRRDYPKALFFSSIIILTSIILASLAIAMVVPHKNLNLVVGVIQAFSLFFEAFGMPWMTKIIAVCVILGGLSGVAAWMIGPTKGIMIAGKDSSLPKLFTKVNKHGVPTGALFLQAIIVSILSLAFVFMPTVNSSFWLLSIITAQLALIVYVTLFAASIKLHHHKREVQRNFKVPFGDFGIWFVAISGIFISFVAIGVGFIPPSNIPMHGSISYEFLLICGMILLSALPFPLYWISRSSKRKKRTNPSQ